MPPFAIVAAALFLASSPQASGAAEFDSGAPAAGELQALIERDWTGYARRIREQDGLSGPPDRLAGLPQALCRRVLPRTYECVSLVRYDLAGGARGSSLLRHHVSRDAHGRLSDAILVRETPAPR
ncbi:MAG TPA: hypothetical protein VD929_03735 [Caulobacteraceae bacterium]|nr:hypothetical protein [Caulobacteraceae bacterium]